MKSLGMTSVNAYGPFAGGADVEDVSVVTCDGRIGKAHVAIAWARDDAARCPMCGRFGTRFEAVAERIEETTSERDEADEALNDTQAELLATQDELARVKRVLKTEARDLANEAIQIIRDVVDGTDHNIERAVSFLSKHRAV